MDISQLLPDLGGWCFKFQGSINPEERMLLPSVNKDTKEEEDHRLIMFCLIQDGGIQDG